MSTQAQAQVVIIGAGIVGSSVAYHLAKLGWKDVVVLEMGRVDEVPGSTSHAPGGVVALSHSKLLTQMGQYASNFYRGLADFSPERKNYNWVGGLDLAINERRFNDLKRLHAESKSFHAESRLVSPEEAQALMPLLNPKAITGGIFVKNSALVAGSLLTSAIQRDATAMNGTRFVPHTTVTDVEVKNNRVTAVITDNPELPRIACDYVVLATNVWGPVLGDKLGVPIPLMAYEHQYVQLTPIAALERFDPSNKEDEVVYPTCRDLVHQIYLRQHWNSMGIGNYWHKPRPVNPHEMGASAMRDFTPEDFDDCWKQSVNLMPALDGAQLTRKFNGIFAFPVDGMPIMGETPVKGLWAACGSWLTHAGGVGKCMAEWMTHGDTEWDMRQVNVGRFHRFQSTREFVSIISDKNYAEIYEIVHPRQPLSRPRNVRLSPFHERWQSLSTSFVNFAGIELPNWCEQNARLLEKYEDDIPARNGWAAEYWSPIQGAEHLETRNNVALFDLTGLSVFEARGLGALGYIEYLCSNKCDVKPGRVVYTCWLTPKGGVRRDLAVARLSEERFWMFVGDGTRPQDWQWANRYLPADSSVQLADISDTLTALGLWGPNARKVLQKVTSDDVSNAGFPYFTSKWIEIGTTAVYALRVSYAGELGWELHIPMDQAAQVWDALWEAGREFGMIGAGNGAFDSLRLEKGYRGWGTDVHTEYTPYEAGLGWTVKLDKGDFMGREACLKLKDAPLARKLCCMTLDAREATLFGAEPIFAAHVETYGGGNGHSNGHALGYVTSANFGYSVGKFLAYGYLPIEHTTQGTRVEIEYFGDRFGATVAEDPVFDAKMTRLRS
jgi:glycine cleavage system aminomethyltransferase T/glycine/D-amino acid oxidase-like deaminating enzyme